MPHTPHIHPSRRLTLVLWLLAAILLMAPAWGEERYLEGRMLGPSSQGGYLLRLDGDFKLQVKDVVEVEREGTKLGRAMVTGIATDGTAVLTLQFHGALRSSDRFIYLGRFDPSWTYADDQSSSRSGAGADSGSSTGIRTVGQVFCVSGSCTVRTSNESVRLISVRLHDVQDKVGFVICNATEIRTLVNAIRTALSLLSRATDEVDLVGRVNESDGRSMSVCITLFRGTPTVGLAAKTYGEIDAMCFLGRGDALELLRLIDRAHSY